MSSANTMMLIIAVVIYILVLAIAIFVGYLIQKAAVKNGTLEALRQARTEGLIGR